MESPLDSPYRIPIKGWVDAAVQQGLLRGAAAQRRPRLAWLLARVVALALDWLQFIGAMVTIWVVGWALFVVALGTRPRCQMLGFKCNLANRWSEALPWQTPYAAFFYISLYLLSLLAAYTMVIGRHLRGGARKSWARTVLGWPLKILLVVLLVTPLLNLSFWTPLIWHVGYYLYNLDVPATARHEEQLASESAARLHTAGGRAQPLVPHLPYNGSYVSLHTDDVVLVGNGPVAPRQHVFIRHASDANVYRFNGMSTLLPDEPVGTTFMRRAAAGFDDAQVGIAEFWGIAPPLRMRGLLEALYMPGLNIMRTRNMCDRVVEAKKIVLIGGSERDVAWYQQRYGIPVRALRCVGLCKELPARWTGGWSSGFLGLLEVLKEKPPNGRVHIFGMNFGVELERRNVRNTQDHPLDIERRIVDRLVKQGRVVVHPPPSQHYHMQVHLEYSGALGWPWKHILRDVRTQGMTCGQWVMWWFPHDQWSPSSWYDAGLIGKIPLPPYFPSPSDDFSPDEYATNKTAVAQIYASSEPPPPPPPPPIDYSAPSSPPAPAQKSLWDALNLYSEVVIREVTAGSEPEAERLATKFTRLLTKSLERSQEAQQRRNASIPEYVNLTQFREDGYVIVDNVLSDAEVDALRKGILREQARHGSKFSALGPIDPGLTIADFMGRPSFSFMHHLPRHPAINRALARIFGANKYRYCSQNDIGINRIVGWHKDRLNDEYKKYQTLPLWGPGSEAPDGGYKIVKVYLFLETHERDDHGTLIVPGSYKTPSMAHTHMARRLHPKKGSIIIIEQRSTHRGMTIAQGLSHFLQSRARERILVSLGYGLKNNHTAEFEAGTKARQRAQCGSACRQPNFGGFLGEVDLTL